MDIYEQHGIVTVERATAMIGGLVKAIGTCGIGEGVTVSGILTEVSPTPIVMVLKGKGHSQPYSVNKNTLERIETLPK